MTIAAGTRLGQYEVQDFLGQGAMGVVFRAYHPQLERTGAVKVLQGISPDPATVARFRHEAQAIARLRHPNIVDVHDFGEHEGTPYMIVEYVPGGSLAARMAQGRLDAATALKYLRGIAAGLDYAHSHGVVHRDVKPANVLLTAEDTPVLADFGLAKLLEGTSLKSMTGMTTGTPAYMAPEQVTGHDVGPAADRYSLATIAYEMLTGVIPFDGQGLMEVLYAQVHREAPAPSSRQSVLNGEVDRVILRGLAKNPAERWATATEFVDALERALSDGAATWPTLARTVVLDPPPTAQVAPPPTAVLAKPKAKPEPATIAMAFPSPPATPTPQPQKRSRRRLAIGLAALLVLLLLMGVCAAVAQATTLTVNPDRVAPGGTVHVTATKVPANQAGEIQLHSLVHTYPFQADGNGQVSVDIDVPADTELGDHVVKICWDNTCHKDAALKVVSGGTAQGSPTPPGTSPSPVTSPSTKPGTTPTPRTTPRSTPSSTPTSTPRSTPTSTPRSTPSASPKPTPSPNPSPSPSPQCPFSGPALSETPNPVLAGGNVRVSGTGFKPGPVTVTYYAGSATGKAAGTATAGSNCGFSNFAVTTSLIGGLLTSRTDKVIACDSANRCASVTFTAKTIL